MKSLKQLLSAKGSQIYSIGPDAKVIEALQLMAQKDVGALVVMEGGRLVGHPLRARLRAQSDPARQVVAGRRRCARS